MFIWLQNAYLHPQSWGFWEDVTPPYMEYSINETLKRHILVPFDIFCDKIGAVVLAVGNWKNKKTLEEPKKTIRVHVKVKHAQKQN